MKMFKNIAAIFFIAPLFFIACKKESNEVGEVTQNIQEKVTNWLNAYKVSTTSSKIATGAKALSRQEYVKLLKENLDFSAYHKEERDGFRDYLIIPFKDIVKQTMQFDESSSVNLLIIVDKAGEIKAVNIAEFIPLNKSNKAKIAANTFHNIFNHKPVAQDGKFKFMSVT